MCIMEESEKECPYQGERNLISLKEFFDFLYLAYCLNHELCEKDKDKDNLILKKRICWDELRDNELVARLFNVATSNLQILPFNRLENEEKETNTGKIPTCTDVCNCQDCLYEFYESEEGVWSFSSTEECKNNQQSVGGLRVKINRKQGHWNGSASVKSASLSPNKMPLIKWVCQVLSSMAAEVVDEGVLDSVLPFIVPNGCTLYKPSETASDGYKKNTNKESVASSRDNAMHKDHEIDIQVCDEVKKSSKIFKCAQGVLLKKMKYFAGVTAGQRLEDMDISVHCDLSTFEWLMLWVKSTTKENLPALTISNVIPVLVSAAFLLMEPLITECLMFLKQNIDEVIQTTPTLSCLNDRTLGRLSELMNNIELESIRDKRDKIHSRLYCKMILSLARKTPEPNRGHYSSISKLYRCSSCNQLLHTDYGRFIDCCSDHVHIDNNGQLQSNHQLDPDWNLNEYIKGLKTELKTWRKVYWWLWGLCHYLNCSYCSAYYPVNRTHWCSYHPQPPQFLYEEQREYISKTGKHVCCGEKTFRFEVFPSSKGCQFRPHLPKMDVPSEKILNILRKQESLICVPPPRFYNEIIRIAKVRDKSSLKTTTADRSSSTGCFSIELLSKRSSERLLGTVSCNVEDCADSSDPDKDLCPDVGTPKTKLQHLYDELIQDYSSLNMDSSSQSDEDDITEDSIQNKGRIPKSGNSAYGKIYWPRRELYSERWIPKLPVRFNQDNLRDREERVVENFIRTLTRKGNELNNMPVKFHSHVQHMGRHPWPNLKNLHNV